MSICSSRDCLPPPHFRSYPVEGEAVHCAFQLRHLFEPEIDPIAEVIVGLFGGRDFGFGLVQAAFEVFDLAAQRLVLDSREPVRRTGFGRHWLGKGNTTFINFCLF